MASTGMNETIIYAFVDGSTVTVTSDDSTCIQHDELLTLFKLKVAELQELIRNIPAEQRPAAWNYWQNVRRCINTWFTDDLVRERDNQHIAQPKSEDDRQATTSHNVKTISLKMPETFIEVVKDRKKSTDQTSSSVDKTARCRDIKEEPLNVWEAELVQATDRIKHDDRNDSNGADIKGRINSEMRVKQSPVDTFANILPELTPTSNSKIGDEKTSDIDTVVHVQMERIYGDAQNLTVTNDPSTDEIEQNEDDKLHVTEGNFQAKKLQGKGHKVGRKRKFDVRKNRDGVKGRPKRKEFSELCIPVRKDNETIVFQCELCGIQMALYQNLEVHLRSHTGQRPFVCSVCGKSFTTKGNMKEHEAIHDTDRPQFECDTCGKMFKQSKCLKIHTRTHTGERPYKCHLCEKSFTQPGVLQSHLLTHTDEKNHLCVTCGKSFRLKSHLELHIKRHDDKRDFKCEDCGFETLTKHDLLRHMVKHTGEKRFTCSRCPKRFTRAHYLKEHMNTHTGKTPFSCSECDASFSLATKLHCHKRKHRRELAEKLVREAQSESTVTQSAPQLKENQSVGHIGIQTINQTGITKQTEKTIKLVQDSENQSNLQEMVRQTPLIRQQTENGLKILNQSDSEIKRNAAIPIKQTRDSTSEGTENLWAGDEQYVELVIGQDISVEDFNALLSSKVISVSQSEGTMVESVGVSVSVQE